MYMHKEYNSKIYSSWLEPDVYIVEDRDLCKYIHLQDSSLWSSLGFNFYRIDLKLYMLLLLQV